VTPIQRY